ncbi:IS1182 family transposase [Methyloterricola oryzae]|uniref:IS1182 family transposase n=1 Tax=Methyloterricola oryzae TaxID=1495050 RepID=UPI0005EBF218|nr:IS1182 family transposase [Methyloterricola oryzae]
MMGQLSGVQERLFYSFSLDKHVPKDHLLRGIDRFLDLGGLRKKLAEAYSPIGRPSIDPELMIRMLVLGYCFGIRSERRLFEEVHLNLAYRWFCRLDLQDDVPDHSTFSKNRHGRFRENDTFRLVFEEVLWRCMAEGLVRGEGFATDASIIKADAQQQRRVLDDGGIDWGDPKQATRPVREYLEGLEETNDPKDPPKVLSLTDPAASWTAATGDRPFFAYSTNYLIDLEHGIIVDVEASAVSKTAEVKATKTMVDRVEEAFGVKPERLVGDTNYGSAEMLAWLVDEKQIAPHVPVCDKTERKDGSLSSKDFEWDGEADEYRCPEGKALRRNQRPFKRARTHVTKAGTIIYRASAKHCVDCPLKARCCPNTPMRKIARSVHEDAREVARRIAKTESYQQSRKDRKKVEMLFAHLKRIQGLVKLRLRGFTGAKDEFLLAAIAQNLRRMAKRLAGNASEALPTPALG